ncbi:MAG: aminoacyl-tRNA hydrolase [Lachnospiraceae bacterium]|nr:aminoacyl-tRNA hydrolase [Lachnospiraceae bacterium]
MKIIAGLGNPTKDYEGTRHNIGFSVIERLADQYNITIQERKHKAVCGKGMLEGEKVLLLKPQTYMNLSGESIADAVAYYKIDPEEDLIVIYDDIDLDVGRIRVRAKGSAGGHNGMKSIIGCLGTQVFSRVRVGVGAKPKDWDLADYVLGRFTKEELPVVEEGRMAACQAVELLVSQGVEAAMNQMNVRKS